MYIEKSIDIWLYMVWFSLYDDDWCCRIKFLTSSDFNDALRGPVFKIRKMSKVKDKMR